MTNRTVRRSTDWSSRDQVVLVIEFHGVRTMRTIHRASTHEGRTRLEPQLLWCIHETILTHETLFRRVVLIHLDTQTLFLDRVYESAYGHATITTAHGFELVNPIRKHHRMHRITCVLVWTMLKL